MSGDVPLFSIVIPTRNRGKLLKHALRSALSQEFEDYEIVVMANNCRDDTRAVVELFANDRIRYFEAEKSLTMPDNWNLAWSKARGKYIVFLSDDDALIPSALRTIAEKALFNKPKVVTWQDAIYYYPDWSDSKLQNILLLFFFGDILVETISARTQAKQLASFDFEWSAPIPKMYNCAVDREYFESWRDRLGQLFFPVPPDYSFAWLATHVCKEINVLNRPLSVRGISDYSCGSNAGISEAGVTFYKEFGEFDFYSETECRLSLTINHIANTFLKMNNLLKMSGVKPEPIDLGVLFKALANQLFEFRDLIPNWDDCNQHLLDKTREKAPMVYQEVVSILSQSHHKNESEETLREMRRRIAKEVLANPAHHLMKAVQRHQGDRELAKFVSALRSEVLVEPCWSYLYMFGETLGAYNPCDIGMHVDYYYELLQRGRHTQIKEAFCDEIKTVD